MWSVELIVGVALISAATLLIVGVVLVRRFERTRHRQLVNSHVTLQRRLSTYHHTNLSLEDNNYSHVPQPTTNLRRSRHLPYGLVTEDWTQVQSKEHVVTSPQMIEQHEPAKAKRRLSLRQTLYGHSFQVPKTRRQKKIEKAIPLNAMQSSPLSAITEFTDSTSEDQPSVELPTDVTHKETDRFDIDSQSTRPRSIQWPLPVAKTRSEDILATQEASAAARKLILMRMNGVSGSLVEVRPSLGPRSLSMASNLSMAPEEPLPPLPPLKIRRGPQDSKRLRLSVASVDTVDSSVLGALTSSPSRHENGERINLDSPGLQDFNYMKSDDLDPSTVSMGIAAGNQTMRGYCRGQIGIGSFHTSVGTQDILQRASTTKQRDRGRNSQMETISASSWEYALRLEDGRGAPGLSPSLPSPIPSRAGRYSMIEPKAASRKRSTGRQGWESEFNREDGEGLKLLIPPRPASVASSQPSQWDNREQFVSRRLSLRERSNGQNHKKGHKRQNCVRIANLPPPGSANRAARLPQMTEEDEEDPVETALTSQTKIPGLTLIETGEPLLRMRASLVDIKASPSPFQNRPVLEPTARSSRNYYNRVNSYGPTGIARPDSDVFNNSYSDPISPNIFAGASSPRNWPLSPTPRNHIKLNSTPPALRELDDVFNADSPILPSPLYTSASLFPRKTLVKGPRQLPRSSGSSRAASPSPTGNKSALRRHGEDLRRSVMTLRRMGSEGKLPDQNTSIYRNISEDNVSTFSLTAHANPTYGGSSTNLSSNKFNPPSTSTANTPFLQIDGQRQMKPVLAPAPGLPSFRVSRSQIHMALSPSVISIGGASIWEDASVRGDSPEPEMPSLSFLPAPCDVGAEDYENFLGGASRSEKDRRREEGLTSLQGKGLGLMVGSKVLGTPGSLYDREGFLKDF